MLEKAINTRNVKESLNARSKMYRERKMGKKPPTKNKAIDLMLEDPNLIRRPLVVKGNEYYQGYEEDSLSEFLS